MRTPRDALRGAGRIVLWGVILLLLLRGVADVLGSEAPVSVAREVRAQPVWPDDEARAFAQDFARAYLTYTPRHPGRYARRLERFAGPELAAAMVPDFAERGSRQVVQALSTARVVQLGDPERPAAGHRHGEAPPGQLLGNGGRSDRRVARRQPPHRQVIEAQAMPRSEVRVGHHHVDQRGEGRLQLRFATRDVRGRQAAEQQGEAQQQGPASSAGHRARAGDARRLTPARSPPRSRDARLRRPASTRHRDGALSRSGSSSHTRHRAGFARACSRPPPSRAARTAMAMPWPCTDARPRPAHGRRARRCARRTTFGDGPPPWSETVTRA